MTNKRKVYNELGTKPKRVATIAKATKLTQERTIAILKQLHKEGRADYRELKTGTGWVKGSGIPPKPPIPKPPPPPPDIKVKPQRSWSLPSPLVMSGVYGDDEHALDPETGKPRKGVGTIGNIIVPGVCPLWECKPVNGQGRGLLGQIEGQEQLQTAYDLIQEHRRPGDHLAIVGTGNVPAEKMVEIGVTVYFIELNAQAGWEPYGNYGKMHWTAETKDKWPWVYPSYGCYVPVSLQEYAAYHPDITKDGGQTWYTSPTPQGIEPYFAIFSGQGMGDTNSWPYLASL